MVGTQKFWRLFAPPHCQACYTFLNDESFLCQACQQGIQFLPKSHCTCCAEPFASDNLTPHLCAACLKKPPAFSKVWASTLYQGTVHQLFHGVKFGRRPFALKFLAELALKNFHLACQRFQPDLLLPVPLSWRRLFHRGFNQSYLLAHYCNQTLKQALPLVDPVHRRHGQAQAQLSRNQRLKGLKNVFSIKHPKLIFKKRILLVDDVLTTGATVEALSHCLRDAGAQSVQVFVVARVQRSSL